MGLGLYLHVPFCKSKCHYCDFCSFPTLENSDTYLEALGHEARLLSIEHGRLAPKTIYVGGGTPTLLSRAAWESLARMLESHFDLSEVVEWSVEGNPESTRRPLLDTLRAIGVNRFSMGIQTMDQPLLETIGRIHTPQDVEAAFEALRSAGFDNVNLDLMTGLPGQTLEAVNATLDRVGIFDPEHLSAYGLKIEEGTRFDRLERQGLLKLPEEDLERAMDHRIREVLRARGYRHYEISNYAKAGRECRHNLNYWNCGSYAALGLSAHGYLLGTRYENTSDMSEYLGRIQEGALPMVSRETINAEEDEKEWLMLRLRLADGICYEAYERRYGKSFLKEKEEAIRRLSGTGWIEAGSEALRLTESGMDFANAVIVEFI
jgi:oxygen-independent coproporphyrinogen-3 oxidase